MKKPKDHISLKGMCVLSFFIELFGLVKHSRKRVVNSQLNFIVRWEVAFPYLTAQRKLLVQCTFFLNRATDT